VWLFCRLSADHQLTLDADEVELIALFVEYFRAIRFWQDEDSGHWEEARKVNASSIGVVVGALREVVRAGVLKGRAMRW
jgi:phosphorylase kinase alpha/beta subunit